jgi:nucleoid DNA-binding protein
MPNTARGGAVGRDRLAEAICRIRPSSRRDARAIVDQVISEIAAAIVEDGFVLLSGFGRFETVRKSARIGRNPKTCREYPINPRRIVKFKPSRVLNRALETP